MGRVQDNMYVTTWDANALHYNKTKITDHLSWKFKVTVTITPCSSKTFSWHLGLNLTQAAWYIQHSPYSILKCTPIINLYHVSFCLFRAICVRHISALKILSSSLSSIIIKRFPLHFPQFSHFVLIPSHLLCVSQSPLCLICLPLGTAAI